MSTELVGKKRTEEVKLSITDNSNHLISVSRDTETMYFFVKTKQIHTYYS